MIKKEKIILIGGGGHCRSCIDVIELENVYEIAGILDFPEKLGDNVLGYPIIGSDEDIDELVLTHNNFFITIGNSATAPIRKELFNKLKNKGKKLPCIISPLAYVSKYAEIGEGSIIMHKAVVNSGARISSNCIVNTSGIIEHDAIVGNNCHVSTSSTINGGVKIGDDCFIASNSVIRDNIQIGDSIIIGMGGVVVADATEKGTYIGNPAKLKK